MIVKKSDTPDNTSSTVAPDSCAAEAPVTFAMPRIKDMDREDTPRERADKFGCGVLSVAELWALILRTGTTGLPVTELCKEMMRRNDGRLTVLERRTRRELLELRGLGRLKALQIEAVLELIRRYNSEPAADNPIVRESKDIFNVMRHEIGNLDHEEMWALIMNRRGEVVKRWQASKGGIAGTSVDIKLIIKEALLENASSVILCHNHPSGNMIPSGPDDNITRQCAEACRLMGLALLDHVIVGPSHQYYSYRDNGKL